jgi:adenylate cyclase
MDPARPAASRGLANLYVLAAVILGIVGLPIAVWLDLTALSEKSIRAQAGEIGRIIDGMRSLYASDVVGRVVKAHQQVTATHDYQNVDGGIPIPATMSIELAKKIDTGDGTVAYRFVSDLPFRGREPHPLDPFEVEALAKLRADPKASVVDVTGSLFNRRLRLVTPVILGPVCVACHNSHPDSPKKDWKEGDVRGIQEVSVAQPIEANIFAFKYLLGYFAAAALAGLGVLLLQRRQASLITGMNRELTDANDFLAAISIKIAKYIPPQIYKSIFSGQRDAAIATERKKLTIFFSDIKDFTSTAERLQPEDLTALLNEYLTAMSAVALEHGGTVDKFIGDAILVFFGDPDTKGVEEDAKACLKMALAMQEKLSLLNVEWRRRGIESPFKARMGINTGYCNVGNFGSDDRMDYTIIGAEANLAARLQAIAKAGEIVMSYETFALVRPLVRAKAMPAITMKGISRDIVPYAVLGLALDGANRPAVIAEHAAGLDLFLDVSLLDEDGKVQARRRLNDALAALEGRKPARRK